MRRLLAIGLATLVVAASSCSEDAPSDPAEAAASTSGSGQGTTTSTGAGAGGEAPEGCVSADGAGEPNGVCEPGELCACPDCAPTAYCNPDQCTPDGVCDAFDACICADCDAFFACVDPADHNCVEDGVCDSFDEGCGCADCATKPDCADNVAACSGGVPNGACDVSAETCECTDCLGDVACLSCSDDGACSVSEACYCADCLDDPFCTDPNHCFDEGVCSALSEGCGCEDCGALEVCQGGAGGAGGAGGGGGGGAGGQGGAGGGSGGGGGGPESLCADGVLGGSESDVDCGGSCPPCMLGEACNGPIDCASGLCSAGLCAACVIDAECASGLCLSGSCAGTCGSPDVAPLPTSCALGAPGAGNSCGPLGNEDCCGSTLIPCGTFSRSYDGATFSDPSAVATLSDFRIDDFEVTVGRFRQFVNSGLGTTVVPPITGSGANPHVPNSGWDPTWNSALILDTLSLKLALDCQTIPTWTLQVANSENLPINCVTWYEAFAFCAADGGFLPTEAQWNYAASGGAAQRKFPWPGATADNTLAVYQCNEDGIAGCLPADLPPVGSKSPLGDSLFGAHDLAGSVSEWGWDFYAATYATPCIDCGNATVALERVLRGGGYASTGPRLLTSDRQKQLPHIRRDTTGFRCARSP